MLLQQDPLPWVSAGHLRNDAHPFFEATEHISSSKALMSLSLSFLACIMASIKPHLWGHVGIEEACGPCGKICAPPSSPHSLPRIPARSPDDSGLFQAQHHQPPHFHSSLFCNWCALEACLALGSPFKCPRIFLLASLSFLFKFKTHNARPRLLPSWCH